MKAGELIFRHLSCSSAGGSSRLIVGDNSTELRKALRITRISLVWLFIT